jgi:hypothetical protein
MSEVLLDEVHSDIVGAVKNRAGHDTQLPKCLRPSGDLTVAAGLGKPVNLRMPVTKALSRSGFIPPCIPTIELKLV